MIYLDTHVVVWLYAGKKELFSKKAIELIEKEDLMVSPMLTLEMEYLYENGKIKVAAVDVIADLEEKIGIFTCDQSFKKIVSHGLKLTWTRDPFDRLIVGHAASKNAKLLSKDAAILKHYSKAVW